MDWFERLTGFREKNYADTKAKLAVESGHLHSLVNGRRYRIGNLELVSLHTLRDRVIAVRPPLGKLKVSAIQGDVRLMHRAPENAGALFQVASQFNLLEMISPDVTPEHGVGRYENDRTQGPACAIAAGAATIYRNYFAPVGPTIGQTADQQLDGLAEIGTALSTTLNLPIDALWTMRNGYALCTERGLALVAEHLDALSVGERGLLRNKLAIGIHSDIEVTDMTREPHQLVSQAFCSALPVAYTRVASGKWTAFASLILQAAYEATLLAAALNCARGQSNIVFLTHLGGGAFGNDKDWITQAIRRALTATSQFDLDVRIVSYGNISTETSAVVNDFR